MPELNPEELAARKQRIEAVTANWTSTQSLMKRLAAIDSYRGAAIYGLMELFEFHDGDVTQGFAANYLGAWIWDLLQDIAWEGAATIANNPDAIRESLDKAIEEMRSDLQLASKSVNRYAGILTKMEKQPADR